MGAFTRRQEIDRRRKRRSKIKQLKAKITKAKDGKDIAKLVEKIKRISPHYPIQGEASR